MSGQHYEQTDAQKILANGCKMNNNATILSASASASANSLTALPQQRIFSPMMHPALQNSNQMQQNHNRHLMSLPSGTVVPTYALPQQQQPTQGAYAMTIQPSLISTQLAQNGIQVPPNVNVNMNMKMAFTQQKLRRTEHQPSRQSIASSIHVSTGMYVAPRPAKASPSSVLISSIRKQNQVNKLAAVPTRKLASRSIISLNLDPTVSQSGSESVSASNPLLPNQQTQLHSTTLNNAQIQRQQLPNQIVAKSPTSLPTSNQIDSRKSSSYSSACDATILAQQELLKDVSSSSQNHSDDKSSMIRYPIVGVSPISLLSVKKRSCPEPDSSEQSKHKYLKVMGGKPSPLISSPSIPTLQKYLENLLASRGYSTQHYCSLETGYYCKPTELQKASYGMTLINSIRTSDEHLLKRILKAGLSPNPCNAFGESAIHMVCRRRDHKLLQIFLDHGCSVQVSDDFGRTPLHDACWTTEPCFKSVKMLLNRDARLLHVVDCRGSAPLSYVKQENWGEWMEFLDRQKDVWWPHLDTSVEGEENPPPLVSKSPHSMPLPDPPRAALCEHAQQIASGQVEPEAFAPGVATTDVTEMDETLLRGEASKQKGGSSGLGRSPIHVVC